VRYLGLTLWPHPLVLDYGTGVAGGLAEVWWQGVIVLMLLAATGLLFTALTLVLVAAVLALAQLVGPVAACVIVALVSAVAAWALARHGLSRLSAIDLAPRRSMATLQVQIDRFTAKTNRKAPEPKEPRP
jgi:hypothetical protein